MSCKSAIFVSNTTPAAVTAGNTLPLGNIVRRFGCALNLNGNGVLLLAPGYYKVDVSATVESTAAGAVAIGLSQDGVQIPGVVPTSSAASASAPVNVSFPAIIRVLPNSGSSTLTLILSEGAGTLTNLILTVEKL